MEAAMCSHRSLETARRDSETHVEGYSACLEKIETKVNPEKADE